MRTLLHGTLLPAPDIGAREAETLRNVQAVGFETGVHCWDHVRWQDRMQTRDEVWVMQEMRRATHRYTDIFGEAPRLHGAAGWQFNASAARAEKTLGIELASDTRGAHPFVPVASDGTVLRTVQLPTTLPTLDELIGVETLRRQCNDRFLPRHELRMGSVPGRSGLLAMQGRRVG